MSDPAGLEPEVRAVGARLADAMPSALHRPLHALDDRLLELTSGDPRLKAALFRMVDVAPACRSDEELAGHLAALLAELPGHRAASGAVERLSSGAAGRRAVAAAVRASVGHMAHRFIAGPDPAAALPELARAWDAGIAASVDLLGEATVTCAEADAYAARCAQALTTLSAASARWPARPHLEADSRGPVPRAELSVKATALTALLRPHAPERGAQDAARRLRPLLRIARDAGAHLHVDSEAFDTRDGVLAMVLDVLSEPEFASGPAAGVVIQAYMRDAAETLEGVLAWSLEGPGRARSAPLTVRLVKGAYWDHEVAEARRHGWEPPVHEDKATCDASFETLTRRLLDARPAVRVAIASHNLRSVAHAIAYDRVTGGSGTELELQVLRGLGDPLAAALAAERLRVRAYCPVGEVVAGMAYLVRRLLENTANDSFLHEQARGADLDTLLAPPRAPEPAPA